MDIVFGVFLIIVFLIIVMRPVLQRWFGPMIQRWAMGKMEDRMRRMAGMPTRKEERQARKRAARRSREGAQRFRRAASGARMHRSSVDMLQVVAEDVEFTEVKTYSEDIEIGASHDGSKEKVKIEQQVEDAEFTEL